MSPAHPRKLDAELTKFRQEQARIFGQARRAANDPATSPEKLRMWLTIIADAGEGWMMLATETADSVSLGTTKRNGAKRRGR